MPPPPNSQASPFEQLETEPANDKECAAKFQLYEQYSETVTAVRMATLDFWEEAASEFAEGNAKAHINNTIRKIDDERNLGFDFRTPRWFVHSMVKTAHANTAIIERILADIKTKLELLASQDECPICLESFGEDDGSHTVPHTTLACCHKVCVGCWGHWRRLNPGNSFCPLCRQQDFLVSILPDGAAAGGAAGAVATGAGAAAGAAGPGPAAVASAAGHNT